MMALAPAWLLVSSPFLDQLYWLLLFLETPNTLFTQEEKTSAKTQTECMLEFHLLSLEECIITAEVRLDL